MRSLLTWLTVFVLFFAMILSSCKKNNSSPGGGSVQGNWKFLFLTAQTQATATISAGVTGVTKSSFTTTGNSGTFAISADSMAVSNLAYSATFNEVTYLYLGNTVLDSTSAPYSENLPATSETIAYKQIGKDSLYFPSGGFSTGGTGSVQASGAHYVIRNDTLKITVQDSENNMGIVGTATETIYLLRQ